MEESDMYIVDARNADHRPQTTGGAPYRPPVRVVTQPTTRIYQPAYAPPAPQFIYAPPQQATLASNLFGKITGGQLVDLVAQIFAALMPLPAAPVATSETATDVGNLILYQTAIVQHEKRDEQIRTLGNIVTKLLG